MGLGLGNTLAHPPGTPIIGDTTFKMTVDTTIAGASGTGVFKLPFYTSLSYNCNVDWGDDTNDDITAWDQAEVTHTYPAPGVFQITITGDFDTLRYLDSDNDKLITIDNWGVNKWQIFERVFYSADNFIGGDAFDGPGPDLSECTNMERAFFNIDLFDKSLNGFNFSNIENTRYMCINNLIWNNGGEQINWDLSNCVNAFGLLRGNAEFNNGYAPGVVGALDLNLSTTCTDIRFMFWGDQKFNQTIDTWNVPNATSVDQMFANCSLFQQSIDSIVTSNTLSMWGTVSAGNWNNSIAGWDTSNVTDMRSLFASIPPLNHASISNLDTSSVLNMSEMFSGSDAFNQDISKWDVSTVTNMSSMFNGCRDFNQSLVGWVTTSLTNISGMFRATTNFNQNLNSLDFSKVTTMSSFCASALAFDNGGVALTWDVSSCTNMHSMFRAVVFSQDISAFVLKSTLTNMTLFMADHTPSDYSAANLDAIYNAWSLLTVASGANPNFGTIKYNIGAQAAKDILTNAPNNWIITDGGVV